MTECGQSLIVYDDALISHIDASLFDPVRWSGAVSVDGIGSGRGKVLFIEHQDQQWALRHYCRGGFARWLSFDKFLWTGLQRTRPFREWSLLKDMHRSALPVPRPVAARVVRRGAVYTADLITIRIPDVTTLSERLSRAPLTPEIWQSIGHTIARFHAAGIYHADLNAHNIQIDSHNRLYLLDFDRGRVKAMSGPWRQSNLDRLHRSFTKLFSQGAIRFSADDWANLLDGYKSPGAI
ncbi:MAG: 3-deoxy-D-manno-octulosonic acid kinase [Gammaproteobacteria bacterium]|jgi:3-deoxy-D-manno-octulosonic acid kinase|nr:3-deoxy-D-manno-octulosonic acid kinase [Gammaproteobacteria bacterium]MDP6673307.1 3-deoxy-D-manno-octulosonic acid kinase [Gammaproteobacteria bacterium]